MVVFVVVTVESVVVFVWFVVGVVVSIVVLVVGKLVMQAGVPSPWQQPLVSSETLSVDSPGLSDCLSGAFLD